MIGREARELLRHNIYKDSLDPACLERIVLCEIHEWLEELMNERQLREDSANQLRHALDQMPSSRGI